MEYTVLRYSNGGYESKRGTSSEMDILGMFLSDDVGLSPSSFKEWFFDDESENACSNATALEKENGYILLSDMYSQETVTTQLKMTRDQFIKLLDDWEEKVCKSKPKEVIIKYENDQYFIETKD